MEGKGMLDHDTHKEMLMHLDDSPEVSNYEVIGDGEEVRVSFWGDVASTAEFNKALKTADAVRIDFTHHTVTLYLTTDEDVEAEI